MLENGGHTVEEAHDGEEGVAMAARQTYDLVFMDISMPVLDGVEATRVFMDISMPVLDGVEATRMIRAAEEPGRHVPIVALTAHALPGEIERFRKAGLDDVLIKPISRASLGTVIERFAGRGTAGDPPSGGLGAPREATMVDRSQIAELRQLLGQERIVRQIGLFLKEAEDLVAEVSGQAPEGARSHDIRASVHRVAGSAALLGATALRAHLQALETRLAGDGAVAHVDEEALRHVVSDTVRALRQVQDELAQASHPPIPKA
ncbi:MAG: response regulator [Rhodobacteraceae bacterium]|nr:response regulator [Paracoccaceae bacterium]